MTLSDAAQQRIDKVRRSNWADPQEHLVLEILEGNVLGPWCYLVSPNIQSLAKSEDVSVAKAFQEVLDVSEKPILVQALDFSDFIAYQEPA